MTQGAEGSAPDYLDVAQAGKFWGVAPWIQMHQSRYWVDVAAQMIQAQNHVEQMRERQQARKRGRAKR